MAGYPAARPRLVLKGFWGKVRRQLPMAQMSRDALLRAQKRGDGSSLRSVILVGHSRKDLQVSFDSGDEKNTLPVCLAWNRIYFSDLLNTSASWTQTIGENGYLKDFPNCFESNTGGVGHARAENNAAFYKSNAAGSGLASAGFPMLMNAPFAMRFLIPEPPDTVAFPVFTLARWGLAGDTDLNRASDGRWQLQIIKGSLHIMRLKDSWTQGAENTLHALEAALNPTTAQQTQIENARAALYLDYTHLDFGSSNDFYSKTRLLLLIPEPRGVINIWDGGKWAQVRHSAILKTRKSGIVWDASRVEVGTNGGAFFWQFGYPQFAPTGKLYLPPMRTQYWQDSYTLTNYNAIHAQGAAEKLPGTAMAYNTEVGYTWAYFVASFSTTDNRYTPFLYGLNAVIPAGTRQGSTETYWDSDDHLISGQTPILDVQPGSEDEFAPRVYTLLISDESGRSFQNFGVGNYDSGQFRVCDYYEDNQKLISNGIVRLAKVGDLRTTIYNQVRGEVATGGTTVTMEICSQEAVLESWTMIEDPIGDFLKTNNYIRQVISLAGIPAGEYSEIPANSGRLCPSAIAGETWASRASRGATTGSYLKDFCISEGMGRVARHLGSGWTYAARGTSVATIEGYPAEFSSEVNDPRSYPGRFAILQWLELTFELRDYFNEFLLEGADDSEGKPISLRWELSGGLVATSQIPAKVFTGTPRLFYQKNDGWRTMDDLIWARRSIMMHYGLPPRWSVFETYYHRGLTTGLTIRVNGTKCRAVRVGDGSWAEDKMIIAYREME